MAFATIGDYATRVGRHVDDFTDEESAQIEQAIDISTDEIRRFTRQHISLVEDDEVVLYGNWSSRLVLPQRPVVSVSALAVDGRTVTVTERNLVRDILWRSCGGAGNWGGPHSKVEVTYTHGFATIPESVKGACLDAAIRLVSNPGDATQESLEGYSVTYAVGGVLTADEKADLRWLRRKAS